MSIFSEANELASVLVFGRHYRSDASCRKPDRLIFSKGTSSIVGLTASCPDHIEWARIANFIQRLLLDGYRSSDEEEAWRILEAQSGALKDVR